VRPDDAGSIPSHARETGILQGLLPERPHRTGDQRL